MQKAILKNFLLFLEANFGAIQANMMLKLVQAIHFCSSQSIASIDYRSLLNFFSLNY
jgi:hypothetical protein